MMSMDVAIRPGGGLAEFKPPTFSPPVERAVREYLDHEAHGNLGRFGVPVLPEHLRQRAAAYVRQADEDSRPANLQAVTAWLTPIAGAVAQTPHADDFATRAAAIQMACQDLPGWFFNGTTALAAVRKFQWFPSAAEVRALLMAETAQHRATLRALRALGAVKAEEREELPAEARKALAPLIRARIAEFEATVEQREAPKPIRATPLTGEALAAARLQASLRRA